MKGGAGKIMYGILIADDNSLARMSLVNMIDWKRHNAELVATAHDGEEAFRLCEEHHPHIVITDIRMPGKDGIYLMKQLQRYYPDIQLIVVSAHGIFEYAKQAMRAGCINYILKPINGEELNETIRTAIRMIQKKGITSDKELFNVYEQILNNFYSLEKEYRFFFLTGKGLPDAVELEKELTILSAGQVFPVRTMYLELLIVVVEKKGAKEALRNMAVVFSQRDKCIYGWKEVTGITDIIAVEQCYKEACGEAALKAFRAEEIRIEKEGLALESMKAEMEIYWSVVNYSGILNALKKHLRPAGEEDYTLMLNNREKIEEFLKYLAGLSVSRFDEICRLLSDIDNQPKEFKYICTGQVLEDVGRIVFLMCEDKGTEGNNGGRLSWQIKKVIDRNYARDINLNLLSSLLSYSPVHLSRTFKRETGMNINRYLIETRMKRAVELLIQTDRNVGKIAEAVGYKDYYNFARQFKKYFGKTPLEYRKMNEGKKQTG